VQNPFATLQNKWLARQFNVVQDVHTTSVVFKGDLKYPPRQVSHLCSLHNTSHPSNAWSQVRHSTPPSTFFSARAGKHDVHSGEVVEHSFALHPSASQK